MSDAERLAEQLFLAKTPGGSWAALTQRVRNHWLRAARWELKNK